MRMKIHEPAHFEKKTDNENIRSGFAGGIS